MTRDLQYGSGTFLIPLFTLPLLHADVTAESALFCHSASPPSRTLASWRA
ncbi:hypothetical protein [uncultured Desulfovibrio sp.]|nr:hypothetical protein [uncultured Desulfovibrio sp.]